jgi:hypothetical protein
VRSHTAGLWPQRKAAQYSQNAFSVVRFRKRVSEIFDTAGWSAEMFQM